MFRVISQNTRHVKDVSERILKNYFRKRGLIDSTFVFQWKEIIGPHFAPYCYPVKFDFPKKDEYRDGALTLYVDRGAALEIEHQKERIIERVNQYFGYKAIGRLVLQQGYFTSQKSNTSKNQTLRPVMKQEEVADIIENVNHDEIKQALKRLGQAMKR